MEKIVFKKIVRVGKTFKGDVFCEIRLYEKKKRGLVLSITGVEAPLSNGDCKGSCGQIYDTIRRYIIEYAPGWDSEKLKKFLDIWENWHLNDMNPCCEHQKELGWGKEKIVKREYNRTTELYTLTRKIKEKALKSLKETGKAKITKEEQELLNLPWYFTWPNLDKIPEKYRHFYKIDKEEITISGHVYPSEHPKGVLGKPCPVCGYKYGSEWVFFELPKDVIEFVKNLPNSDKRHPWMR